MDYETYIRNISANDGQLCSVQNYANNCQNQCTTLTLNSNQCFSCLSNVKSCASPTVPTSACCPYVAAAVACNNCLNQFETNALAQCLATGALAGWEIALIVIACVIVVIGVGVGVGIYVQRRRQKLVVKAQREHSQLTLDQAELLSDAQLQSL